MGIPETRLFTWWPEQSQGAARASSGAAAPHFSAQPSQPGTRRPGRKRFLSVAWRPGCVAGSPASSEMTFAFPWRPEENTVVTNISLAFLRLAASSSPLLLHVYHTLNLK